MAEGYSHGSDCKTLLDVEELEDVERKIGNLNLDESSKPSDLPGCSVTIHNFPSDQDEATVKLEALGIAGKLPKISAVDCVAEIGMTNNVRLTAYIIKK